MCLTAFDSTQAGHAKFTFEEDPLGILDVLGNAQWMTEGGNPGGYLEITSAAGSLKGVIIFDDFDNGAVVSAFTFTCDLKVGDGTADPADGFSVNYARANDPVITTHDGNGFAGINTESNLPEEGTQTGLGIGFDSWNSGGVDAIGISVRVDNTVLTQIPMPTKNGAPTDATSLQTGPRDTTTPGSGSLLTWQPLKLQLTEDAKLNIWWKGTQIVTNLQTTYFPSKGRLVFAGRTGGSYEMQAVDNIEITTVTPVADTQPPTTPANFKVAEAGAGRVLLTWGASTDNSDRVSYQIERNGTVLPNLITATQFEDRGVLPKTAYTYKLTASDLTGNASPAVTASTTTVADVALTGTVKGEIFDNINGTLVQNLLDDPKFQAGTPDRVLYLDSLSSLDTLGDNYGLRITGVLTAPETAQYDFFIRSDDASALFLNRQGATLPDPNLDTPIAQETDCCEAFLEPGTFNDDGTTSTTTEAPISLQAGKQYGFVVLLKEGGGGDMVQVAWRKVGDTTPAANLPGISGVILAGRGDGAFSSVAITQPPADATIVANESTNFSVKADTKSAYSTNVYYQWYKDGAIIGGAVGSTYTLPVVAASDAAKYKATVSVNGASATSAEATLTVTTDTKPATLAAVSSDDSFTAVMLKFSEPVKARRPPPPRTTP